MLHLDKLLAKLERPEKPTILLLDEAQELARGKNNFPLIAALRTSLDTRSDGIRAIFTGSSRDGLRAMFSEREAPFFHFGTQVDLEALSDAFVDHMLSVFKKIVDRELDREEAIAAFETLHRSPYFFRGLIEMLILESSLTLSDGLEAYRARLAERLGYEQLWKSLPPLQREVLKEIATENPKPFAQGTLTRFGEVVDATPAAHEVQTALRQLSRADVVDKWSGDWRFVDDEFRVWVSRVNGV